MRNRWNILYTCLAVITLAASGCGLDWNKTYEYDDQDPFDLYVLYELLEARDAGLTLITDSLPPLSNDAIVDANYVFVGEYAYYNQRDITHLLSFVERGNNAFIAADRLPEELAEQLYGSDCYYEEYDIYNGQPSYYYQDDGPAYTDSVVLTLSDYDASYQLSNIYKFKPYSSYWSHIPEYHLCDPELDNSSVGYIATGDTSHIAYVRLAWGDGAFYFNTLPQFFTNYYLVDTIHQDYAEGALAMSLTDGPVFWDEASRVPPAVARQRRQQQQQNRVPREFQGRNLLSGNEALSYIQNQPSLALAWYLIIVAVFLYVFFRGKRRQRIIPIINRRENSSQRFIDTLSRLVFQKGNHAALARQELRSLKFHLLDKYGIRWQSSDPLPENFAELTGASSEVIVRANIEISIINSSQAIDESALVKFHRAIEPLYQLSNNPAGPLQRKVSATNKP